jgi:hypothetical protein
MRLKKPPTPIEVCVLQVDDRFSALQHQLLPNFLPNNSANVLFGRASMTLAIIVFLAFGAGFITRSFMNDDDARDLSEIGQHAGGRYHSYD